MRIRAEQLQLQLENPFKLSYGATTIRENVLVHLELDALQGTGEAAVVPYYGETPARVSEYLLSDGVKNAIQDDPCLLEDMLDQLPHGESTPAKTAMDMALHDLWAKALRHPLYRVWGLNPNNCPQNSFTVSMAENEADYRENLRAAKHRPLIKLKLGSGDPKKDLELVNVARSELQSTLCVDANGGWTADQALEVIPQLKDVIFIEQPVAKDDLEGWRTLKQKLPSNSPPLIADESVQGVESVSKLVGLVDGINIKLAKCGGLRAARQMITLARAANMGVMIGCMIESSVAITAAAHLAPLADYADLDGNLLITNDPYVGVKVENGRIILPEMPGLGVVPR